MKILSPGKTLTAVLTALIFTSTAHAGSLNAVLNGKSYHVDSTYEWNEDNIGFGLEYQFDTNSRWRRLIMANGFRDSNNDMSYFAGAGIHRRLIDADILGGLYLDAGINAFVMTREDINNNKPFPGALPSMSFGNRHIGFNLTYLPVSAITKLTNSRMADPTVSGIWFMQFKVSMNSLLPD